jgi:hypothetical protein
MRGIRGMSSLLLESEDAGFLLQVRPAVVAGWSAPTAAAAAAAAE